MKYAVVYYSLTGNSKVIAENIGKQKNIPVFEIEELKKRSNAGAYLTGSLQALQKKGSQVKKIEFDMNFLKGVIMVGPVWAGRQAPALNAFMRENMVQGKDVYCVMVSASGKGEKIRDSVKALVEGEGCRFKYFRNIKAGKAFMEALKAGQKDVDVSDMKIE